VVLQERDNCEDICSDATEISMTYERRKKYHSRSVILQLHSVTCTLFTAENTILLMREISLHRTVNCLLFGSHNQKQICVVLDLPTMIMKNTVFWDVTPCSPVEVHQRFGGIYCLHLQD
jgi:hypothetical protein